MVRELVTVGTPPDVACFYDLPHDRFPFEEHWERTSSGALPR